MKRLTLYLFRHLIVATLFVTAGLTLVIWLTQSLRLLEIVVDGGAPIYLFLQLMLVTLPTFLSIVLPIGLLAAVLFTYNRLTMDSELVVMRAAGLGPWGLAKPAVLLGLIVMAICYGLTLYLAPASYGELARLEGMAKSQFSTVFLREGVFNEAGDGLTVYVRRRMADGELQGLLIHDTRVEGQARHDHAERGRTVEGGAGARVVVFDGNRQEMDLETGRMSQLFFDRYAVDFRVFERQLSDRLPDARERSTNELMHAGEIPELAPVQGAPDRRASPALYQPDLRAWLHADGRRDPAGGRVQPARPEPAHHRGGGVRSGAPERRSWASPTCRSTTTPSFRCSMWW